MVFSSTTAVALPLVIVTLGMLVLIGAIVSSIVHKEGRVQSIRLVATHTPPELNLERGRRWHLFLSQYALAALPAPPTHATCCAHMYGRAVCVCPAPGTTRTRS